MRLYIILAHTLYEIDLKKFAQSSLTTLESNCLILLP